MHAGCKGTVEKAALRRDVETEEHMRYSAHSKAELYIHLNPIHRFMYTYVSHIYVYISLFVSSTFG